MHYVQGAFGKVKLVKKKDSSEYYALKIQRKDFIVKHKQEDVVVKEYEIMKKLSHPNIVTMHCAMQDCRYLYFLMAFLPGGTLMDILGDEGGFSDEWIKFYSASVNILTCDVFVVESVKIM
jgi:protein kinase A